MAKLPRVKSEEEVEIKETETEESQSSTVSTVVDVAQKNAEEANAEEVKETEDAPEDENSETAPPAPTNSVPPVTVVVPKETVKKEATVKVSLICNHSCTIGGVPYHFTKGKIAYVPEPVKEILRRAGLLAAL